MQSVIVSLQIGHKICTLRFYCLAYMILVYFSMEYIFQD